MCVMDAVVVNEAVNRSKNVDKITFKQYGIEMRDHGCKPPKYGRWLVIPICLGGSVSWDAIRRLRTHSSREGASSLYKSGLDLIRQFGE